MDTIPKPGNKIIHLVRHAQGFHNLSHANHTMHDPLLTDLGKDQCAAVAASFPTAQRSAVTLLAASPLRRTLYTALYSFPSLVARGLNVVALPEAQETGDIPCDTGSSPERLRKEFEGMPVDLGLVHEGWNSKTGVWAADSEAVRERALVVRRWLREREEDVIVLVSHGGFMHYLNEDWEGFRPEMGTGWKNCEWRTYEFKGGKEDGNATLVETEGSKQRRVGKENVEYEQVEGQKL